MAQLTEGQFATIEWVLKRYGDAQDRTEGWVQALAEIAPDLDAWLRSLLEIVRAQGKEIEAIHYAAHMPDDYEFGLPSWINQHLYGELIMLRDADGRPIRRSEDIAEILRLRAALEVAWIPCKKRMPDTSRHVWTAPVLELDITPVAAWYADQWWIDDRPLGGTSITHWAEIRLPEPPKEK